MMKNNKFNLLLISLCLAAAAVFAASEIIGIRVNTTSSVPIGLYKISTIDSVAGTTSICVGDLIVFDSNAWPVMKKEYSQNRELVKRVLGVPGDIVSTNQNGRRIEINGKAIENSTLYTKYGDGTPLPQYKSRQTYRLGVGEFYAGSDSPYGCDSRYFGPVQSKYIKGKAFRIWTELE